MIQKQRIAKMLEDTIAQNEYLTMAQKVVLLATIMKHPRVI